jgi:hypothetical protein
MLNDMKYELSTNDVSSGFQTLKQHSENLDSANAQIFLSRWHIEISATLAKCIATN